jgi:hypothetical protein
MSQRPGLRKVFFEHIFNLGTAVVRKRPWVELSGLKLLPEVT